MNAPNPFARVERRDSSPPPQRVLHEVPKADPRTGRAAFERALRNAGDAPF